MSQLTDSNGIVDDNNDNSAIIASQWQGPLPPPSVLKDFDLIIENGAERIMHMAELEQIHRHDYEIKILRQESSSIFNGQWLGAFTATSSIAAATFTAYIGAHWSVSCALVGVPMLGIVKAIVNRK